VKYDYLTPGEIVARAYSAFEPAPMWDADRLQGMKSDALPRLYCPDCRKHGMIRRGDDYAPVKRNPANANKHASQQCHWFCSLCKSWHRRPLVLREQGTINGVESRSHKDNDWKIVDGIGVGKIMSALDSAPTAVRLWALWSHTHLGTAVMQNALVEHALVEADKSGIDRPKTFKEGRAALILAIKISEDAKTRARNGLASHTAESLAAAIGVHRSQMVKGRRWGMLSNELMSIYDSLDAGMARIVIEAISAPIRDTA
jgi:hypothetical protein